MSCLDDRTIFDLLRGGLDEVTRGQVEDELARCARCAAVVGALMRERATTRGGIALPIDRELGASRGLDAADALRLHDGRDDRDAARLHDGRDDRDAARGDALD